MSCLADATMDLEVDHLLITGRVPSSGSLPAPSGCALNASGIVMNQGIVC